MLPGWPDVWKGPASIEKSGWNGEAARILDPQGSIGKGRKLPWPDMRETQLTHGCQAFAQRDMCNKVSHQNEAPSGSTTWTFAMTPHGVGGVL
jgi:hypothetical protein